MFTTRILLGLMCYAVVTLANVAMAVDLAAPVVFNIAPQQLPSALLKYSEQSGVQVSSYGRIIEGKESKGVVGTFAAQNGLDQLLKGTGLSYEVIDPKTVAIRKVKDETASNSAQSNEAAEQMRIAQGADAVQRQDGNDNQAASMKKPDEFQEIIVTGTHIRGASINTSPLIEITREDIERSGAATVTQLLEKLPQNFGTGREGSSNALSGTDTAANVSFSSSINLRGLGADSTLVLLDGRRLAPSGVDAGLIDLSAIPLSAVEKVDVLTDGASAIYGSDAVGGVVNFILRKTYDGAETRLRYGAVTDGDSNEWQASQVLGKSWRSGNALLVYEHYKRGELEVEDRDYASDSDLRRFGGQNFSLRTANPGNITRGTQTFAIPAGQNGVGLSPSALQAGVVNFQNSRLGTDLLPNQKQDNVFLSASQQIGTSSEIFASGGYGRRDFEFKGAATGRTLSVPSTNPFYVNPFGGTANVSVQYSFFDDLGPLVQNGEVETYNATTGASLSLGNSWKAQLYGAYSHVAEDNFGPRRIRTNMLTAALADPNPATAFNPFGDGSYTNPQTLAAIASGYLNSSGVSTVRSLHAQADGQLFEISGGAAKLALGVEATNSSYDLEQVSLTSTVTPSVTPASGERDVVSGFAELYLPIVGAGNRRPGVDRLAVSLAGRFDHYDDFGDTTNPKFSFAWAAVESLTLRGSIGTSFKAPLLSQLSAITNITSVPLPDSTSPTGVSNILVFTGSKDLSPEKSTTWTFGLDYSPPESGFNARLDYFHINLQDRIRLPTSNILPVLADPVYASIVTRNPGAATVLALYADRACTGCDTSIPPNQVAALVDVRTSNIAETRLRGVDAQLGYERQASFGAISLSLNASYLLDYLVAITPTASPIDLSGTIGNPTTWRVRSTAGLTRGHLTTSVSANFIDSYNDTVSVPTRKVDSWTTADLQLAYNFSDEKRSGWIDGTQLTLNVSNLFDQDPPFVNYQTGFDPVNASALGRFVSLQLGKRW